MALRINLLKGITNGRLVQFAQEQYDNAQTNGWAEARALGMDDDKAERFAHLWAIGQLDLKYTDALNLTMSLAAFETEARELGMI